MLARTVCAVAAALLGATAQAGAPTPFAPPAAGALVLYRGATLIDGTGSAARANMDVLVDGERIKAVAPAGTLDAALTARARMIDLHGRYLIPGLIDSHVHLATPPNRRQAEAILRRDLYGGVTAVRDMADDLRAVGELARANLVGELAGPDIYFAALMAGPDFFTDPRTAQVSAGGTPGAVPWMQAITAQTDLPLAVAMARGTYATAIKLYADLPGDLAARITAEAHRQHLLVWAHATLYPAKPSEMIAAGVDSVSHACLLTHEATPHVPAWTEPHDSPPVEPFAAGNAAVLQPLFAEMARRGTVLDATVWVFGDTANYGPAPCDERIGGAITGQAWRAGVPVSAGTDRIAPWGDPWPDVFHELGDLAAFAGMSPEAMLQSATSIGARAIGRQADMGSIEPGKLANLVVLARNPLERIDNLKTVVMIVKRGRLYRRRDFLPLRKGDISDP